jgi:hypothetical protein
MIVWVVMSIEPQQTVLMGLYASREVAIEAVRATKPDDGWEITEPSEEGEFELSHRHFGLFTIWPETVKS